MERAQNTLYRNNLRSCLHVPLEVPKRSQTKETLAHTVLDEKMARQRKQQWCASQFQTLALKS